MPLNKFLISLLVFSIVVAMVMGNVLLWKAPLQFPQVNGVFLAQIRPLPEFELLDQHNNLFAKKDLLGKWNIITYGFTSCSDVCPMIMVDLNNLSQKFTHLKLQQKINFIFYSIDPQRDSIDKLNNYLNHFNPDFIGLVSDTEKSKNIQDFEKSLGLNYRLIAGEENEMGYDVAHGLEIFIVNPAGNLQAVLTPPDSSDGVVKYRVDRLYKDFVAISEYYENQY